MKINGKKKLSLDQLVEWTFAVFDSLDPNEKYQLAFSCGKDSWCLLGTYIKWSISRGRKLNIEVVFSDTWLESEQLYKLVKIAQEFCESQGLKFTKVYPKLERSFWVLLIGRGYPVPNHINRWCTNDLKIKRMKTIPGIVIAGSHKGESSNRDKRLDGCGSTECGIDDISNKIEPLAIWRNCSVWDSLMEMDGVSLPKGIASYLLVFYQRTAKNELEDPKDSSMRMGCFMCPVVGYEKIAEQVKTRVVPAFSTEVRALIEELRYAPRIQSEKLGGAGAILVDARIEMWRKLQIYIPQMKQFGWIDDAQIDLINELLVNRSYPETYRSEWVREQEPLAKPWIENTALPNEFTSKNSIEWLQSETRFSERPQVKTDTNKEEEFAMNNLASMMTYNLPAIRGIQGNHEYFVAQIPYSVLFNITVFDESSVAFSNQAQRPLDEDRAKSIKDYVLNHSTDYTFNSLVVAIGSDVEFQEMTPDNPIGILKLPIDCVCRILDGQHRWHGIKEAVAQNPDLRQNTISVVFFLAELSRMRQIFTDLNLYVKPPSKSLSIAYDSRDERAIIVNALHYEIPFFRKFVDHQVNTVPLKSSKLFSLQHLYQATQIYLSQFEGLSTSERKAKALEFWNQIYSAMPDWKVVDNRQISSVELKRDYVCTQGVTLQMLAYLGLKTQNLSILNQLDWMKSNPFWVGLLIDSNGRMISSKKNAQLTADKVFEWSGVVLVGSN